MDSSNEPCELALSMADLDAGFGDYRDALNWLDVAAEREQLPRAYESKRRDWIAQVEGRQPALAPRGL